MEVNLVSNLNVNSIIMVVIYSYSIASTTCLHLFGSNFYDIPIILFFVFFSSSSLVNVYSKGSTWQLV